jgi:dihydrofolate reductase
MPDNDTRVTIHMVASLEGYVAREDGSVDWMETSDEYPAGSDMDPETVQSILDAIDCYVMGSRTYETAFGFDADGLGWPYGAKPTYVLTHRDLPRNRDTVEFLSGDLTELFDRRPLSQHRSIWVVGGGELAGECLRLGIADEVIYSMLPILIGSGIPFFGGRYDDVPLHLAEVQAYRSGMVELRYEVIRSADAD